MTSIEREYTYVNITVTTYASVIACVQDCNRSTLSFEQSSKNVTKSCSEATRRNVLRRISQMTAKTTAEKTSSVNIFKMVFNLLKSRCENRSVALHTLQN